MTQGWLAARVALSWNYFGPERPAEQSRKRGSKNTLEVEAAMAAETALDQAQVDNPPHPAFFFSTETVNGAAEYRGRFGYLSKYLWHGLDSARNACRRAV